MIGNFRLPVSSSAGSGSSSTYTRPSDWLALPSVVSGDQKAVLLHAVFDHDSNFCAFQCASNYTVDWGDGTTNNYAANVSAYHVFDYNYAGFVGTETSEGFRQAIVTITPQATFNLTKLDFGIKHNQAGLSNYVAQWLDVKMAGASIAIINFYISTVTSRMMQQFDFVGPNLVNTYYLAFRQCTGLVKVVNLYTENTVNLSSIFYECYSLKEIPLLTAPIATDCSQLFYSCFSLEEIPLINTALVTNMLSMFRNCYSLKEIPLLNTSSVTNMNGMFVECRSLKTIPLLNTALVTNMDEMFAYCRSLRTIPLINTIKVTSMFNMFQYCDSLKTIPLLNLVACTNIGSMFYGCNSLNKVPLLNTWKVTTFTNVFVGCASLTQIPLWDTGLGQNFLNMFNGSILSILPAFNLTTATNLSGIAANTPSLSRFKAINIKINLSVASCKLSKVALLEIFGNLKTAVAQTITITGNWGADTEISKTSCGTTAGSNVVTQSNTASLAVGMLVLGTGISTSQAVTFQDTGDTVTLNSHGLVDGNIVSFPTIVTTTGIAINTPCYVVNSTTNTFQVSLTLGGSAIALTTNGTGTVAYGSYIQSIITNTSFTLDKPASATGTVTLTSRILDTSIATLKGWTVTG